MRFDSKSFRNLLLATAVISTSLFVEAQNAPTQKPSAPTQTQKTQTSKPKNPAAQSKAMVGQTSKKPLNAQQKFALEVVQSAVAIPQSDQQDRLRVLSRASAIALPLRADLARQFSREGLQIEQELIRRGVMPAASMLESGAVDCKAVTSLIQNVPPDRINAGEPTIVAGVSRCQSAVQPAQRLIDGALEKGNSSPDLALAVMDIVGSKNAWTQDTLEKMLSSLPADVKNRPADAVKYAEMYSRFAPEVDKDQATKLGLRVLAWLGKQAQSGEKNLAINVATDAMKTALGEEAYQRALATDVVAKQVAQQSGQPGGLETPPEEIVTVQKAIRGADRTNDMADLPPSLRAREAAANGFANGTDGNKKLADRYFDVAFTATDEMWRDRSDSKDAAAVVQEVSEAAAHVDAVQALSRAQKLYDSAAQAIGMLAVARVVASHDENSQPTAQNTAHE